MDDSRDPFTISAAVEHSNEIPSGGRRKSPPRRSAKVTKEPRTSTGPNRNASVDPLRHTTGHDETAVTTVSIGSRPPGSPPTGQTPVDRFHLKPEELEETEFPQRLAVLGGPSLFGKNQLYGKDQIYNIELATLQRMAIHDLQHRLVRLVAHIHNNQYADEGAMDTARRLLDDYSTSIRNYDLMNEKKERSQAVGHRDPFLITTEDRLSFILMDREGLLTHPDKTEESNQRLQNRLRRRSTAWNPKSNMLPGESRTEMRKRNEVRLFFERFTLGAFGGLAIIAPMLVMALSNSLLVSLVVTSVTTMLFAVLLALPMIGGTLDGPTVLASVAAYAAILVVFVGTSLSMA